MGLQVDWSIKIRQGFWVTMIFVAIGVFESIFVENEQILGMASAQDQGLQSRELGLNGIPKQRTNEGVVPFAHYEERLRQSERWKTMTDEERQQALQKIEGIRKQFLERQQLLKNQYGLPDVEKKKNRESLMSRRRRLEQYKDEGLWANFQALPLKRRLKMEKELGLDRIVPSQRQKKFDEHLQRLPFSRREKVIRELELSVR